MPCKQFGNVTVCYSLVYRYKDYYFEWHSYSGPAPLRKDGEISERFPKGFWDMVDEFQLLTEEEKVEYRVN